MANKLNSNTWYIDSTTEELDLKNAVMLGLIVTATSANAVLVLSDRSTTVKKMEVRVPTAGSSQYFDFSRCPVVFPNGLKVTTLTNCVATAIGIKNGA